MTHTGLDDARPDDNGESPLMSSPALQSLFQSLLATVANMDFAYERERETVSAAATDLHMKTRMLEKLATRHRDQREPYIQHLAALQDRLQRGWH